MLDQFKIAQTAARIVRELESGKRAMISPGNLQAASLTDDEIRDLGYDPAHGPSMLPLQTLKQMARNP
jgi:hypothetical protein